MGKVLRLGLLQKLFMNIKQLGCSMIILSILLILPLLQYLVLSELSLFWISVLLSALYT